MMRIALGACGTGKTHLLGSLVRDVAKAGWRPLVVNFNPDDTWGPDARVVTPEAAALAMRDRKPGAVVVQVPRGFRGDVDTFAALTLASPGTVLVLPEAYRWLPEGKALPPAFKDLVHTWRHSKNGLFLDCQAWRDVRKEVVDACRWVYAFPSQNVRDARAWNDLGGPPLVEAVARCAGLFHASEPGWHVQVQPNAPRPQRYPLHRLRPDGTFESK